MGVLTTVLQNDRNGFGQVLLAFSTAVRSMLIQSEGEDWTGSLHIGVGLFLSKTPIYSVIYVFAMANPENEDVGVLYLQNHAIVSDAEFPISLEGVPQRVRVLLRGSQQTFFYRFLDAPLDGGVEPGDILLSYVWVIGKGVRHTYFQTSS